MYFLVKISGFPIMSANCRRFLFANMLGQASLELFTDAAIVKQTHEFGPVHRIEPLQQRALEKVFVSH